MTTLPPELEKIRQEAAENERRLVALAKDLGEKQLDWRPEPGRWSIAEILIHLRLTNEACLPSLDHAIEDARRKKLLAEGPFRLGWMGRFFVWYVEPPPVIRLPSPAVLRPPVAEPAGEALPRLLDSRRHVLARLEAASGLDLERARFVSPFASFVKMSLLAIFSVFTAHERRHLWQGENVRRLLSERPALSGTLTD
ncbi:MAG: DinB family protein [Acidobacteriota bacterium]|nr:DinB family protein [Acidobacteriota bacterium]